MFIRKKKIVKTNPVTDAVSTVASGLVLIPILIIESVFGLFNN